MNTSVNMISNGSQNRVANFFHFSQHLLLCILGVNCEVREEGMPNERVRLRPHAQEDAGLPL